MFPLDPRAQKVQTLIEGIADQLNTARINDQYNALDLDPTTSAYTLAAHAAAAVLLAHEAGQTVAADRQADAQAERLAPRRAAKKAAGPKAPGRAKAALLSCPWCDKTFKTNGRRQRHLDTTHPSTSLPGSPEREE